jgi:serine/threonine-protein kinase RsbT
MSADGMSDLEIVTRILERHISPIHARSVLRHALSEHRLTPAKFKMADLPTINASLQRGLRLFSSELAASRALKAIAESAGDAPTSIEPASIDIIVEGDISRARNVARHMCDQAGAKPFSVQKVTTIVSELARNIVSYSKGGKVELVWKGGAQASITIRAIDRGPGIPNLAHVMSGEYQSKTGLGRGMSGTKRLADSFDVTTGPSGTHVTVEVVL